MAAAGLGFRVTQDTLEGYVLQEKKRSHHVVMQGSWQGPDDAGGLSFLLSLRLTILTGDGEFHSALTGAHKDQSRLVEGSCEWQLVGVKFIGAGWIHLKDTCTVPF